MCLSALTTLRAGGLQLPSCCKLHNVCKLNKKTFAKWNPQVLQDYVKYGQHDEQTAQGIYRVVSFDRDL